jgi:hypothetical protein|nr:MAG TPA: Protein of unknown function (DUF1360) [Caudoviricetes sp.]
MGVEFLNAVILIGLLAAFVLLFLRKIGIIEHVQVKGNEFFSKMAHCDFCLSWWTCCVLTFILIVLSHDASYIALPLFATPLTRYLL